MQKRNQLVHIKGIDESRTHEHLNTPLGLGDLALKQYFKCKKALEEEFNLHPSEPTEKLFHKIQQGQPI